MCLAGINVVQWGNIENTHIHAEKEMHRSLTTTCQLVAKFPYLAGEANERPKKWFVGLMQRSTTITKTKYYKYDRNAAWHSTMLHDYINTYIF